MASAKAIHDGITGILLELTRKSRSAESLVIKQLCQSLGIRTRCGKDDSLLVGFVAQQVLKQRLLMIQVITKNKPLNNILVGR